MTANSSPSILSLFHLTDDQRAAATARDRAISVMAGAGSGKTRTLVGRYLSLLESGAPLRSLVAITFTEKAAREMRNRIRALTAAWSEQAEAVPDREVWTEAFSALDAARISTIHGLCAAILRAHPAEAGLDPAFSVLDEGQSAVWRARAVEEGLAWAAADSDVAQLFSFWQEAQLRRLLAELLERRLDAEQALIGRRDDPLELWATALDRWLTDRLAQPAWQQSLATLAGLQAQKEDDKLEIARREVLAQWAEAAQAQADRDWDGLFDALLAAREAISTGGQKGNWPADDLLAAREAMGTLRAHFDQVISRLVDKKKPWRWSLDRQAAELLPLVRRLFEQTRAVYQGYKNEAQALDFDDLEQMTAQLLAHNQTVRTRWQQEINAVLLVDEFQDTNQRQREIVYALAGFEPGNEGLEAREQRSRGEHFQPSNLPPVATFQPFNPSTSLFIVGDAKQSIYRFRGADVAVFRQVQADIEAAGGALINFDLTFRAHQRLVELANALLAPLMPAEDDAGRPYDVPFAPLTAFRREPRAPVSPPYLEFQLGLGEDKEGGRLAAAVGLAGRLLELQRNGQIEWQDVALLFRASTAFGAYEDALEQAGIPFVTVAGRGFYDRPEIRDLLNALAAVADPTDDLAMVGLLRSPAIGLSDGAIHLLRWATASTRRSFWSALHTEEALAELAVDDRDRAEFARQLIAELYAQAGRITVAQLLKTFLDATRYRAVLRLASRGDRLQRNVDKLLADAHRSELVSVPEFLEYLTALGDVGVRESEAPTEAGGAVQLMTIHKAKGLEFPVVVLADAGYSGGFRSAPFYLDQQLGLLLNFSDGEARPAAAQLAAWRETEQEAAEERRLLYVAATRAMEKFIVSGSARLSTARANPGRLLLSGWLAQLAEVVGLSETQLPEMPTTTQIIPLTWEDGAATCTIYPPLSGEPGPSTEARTEGQPETAVSERPDLLASLTVTPSAELDEKLKARESDPPPRVWRVVPPTQYDVPAWVVGSLTHVALRYWRFPDGENWADFLSPFALEAGLSDEHSIDIALKRVSGLLSRFQAHPLYSQLSTAERHHELPYSLRLNDQTQSGIIDLLFRSAPDAPWTIAEFKTDRLAENVDLKTYAQQKGYIQQVEAYQQAVTQQLGTSPEALLIFLNVAQSVQVLALHRFT
ncbi:MAG: UvrD-helicase domain-containing protein [Chloroflexota bacterium]